MQADEGFVYDNSSARNPCRLVAHSENGDWIDAPRWPVWADLSRCFDGAT